MVCIGELAKNIYYGASGGDSSVLYFETKEDFFGKMDSILEKGDTVLIKASNGMKFKEIVERFHSI